jgi:hypothetical protein
MLTYFTPSNVAGMNLTDLVSGILAKISLTEAILRVRLHYVFVNEALFLA